MSCCSHCQEAGNFFNEKKARRELKRYRKKGPIAGTAKLIGQLRPDAPGKSLLDVGGGIGAIQHELFKENLASSTQVDASQAYLQLAEEEARNEGYADRWSGQYGDFVELAADLPKHDLVALDRVICCYPYLEELLRAAARCSNERIALVYPKVNLLTRMGFPVVDLALRLWGSSFQIYLHPREATHRILEEEGFRPLAIDKTWLWHVETFGRSGGIS